MTRVFRESQLRTALLTWMAIWPLITGLLAIGEPVLETMPLPLKTLVLTGILVPVMKFAVMPRLTRWADALMGDADPGE